MPKRKPTDVSSSVDICKKPKLSSGVSDPLWVFPVELWEMIVERLNDCSDVHTFLSTFPQFDAYVPKGLSFVPFNELFPSRDPHQDHLCLYGYKIHRLTLKRWKFVFEDFFNCVNNYNNRADYVTIEEKRHVDKLRKSFEVDIFQFHEKTLFLRKPLNTILSKLPLRSQSLFLTTVEIVPRTSCMNEFMRKIRFLNIKHLTIHNSQDGRFIAEPGDKFFKVPSVEYLKLKDDRQLGFEFLTSFVNLKQLVVTTEKRISIFAKCAPASSYGNITQALRHLFYEPMDSIETVKTVWRILPKLELVYFYCKNRQLMKFFSK